MCVLANSLDKFSTAISFI